MTIGFQATSDALRQPPLHQCIACGKCKGQEPLSDTIRTYLVRTGEYLGTVFRDVFRSPPQCTAIVCIPRVVITCRSEGLQTGLLRLTYTHSDAGESASVNTAPSAGLVSGLPPVTSSPLGQGFPLLGWFE